MPEASALREIVRIAVWTRQRLREAGYGAEVDAIEEREA